MIILTIIILITMLTSALPLSNVLTLYAQPGVRVVASRPQASVTTIAAAPTCDPNKNANCRANITSTTTLSGNNPAIPAHATPTTNPLPGIDIGNAYWTTDPTVIVSTNPNTPQSQSYILQLKNGIIDYRNALKSKSGNPNAWNINVQDGKQYYSDSQYVPPDQHAIFVSLDGDKNSQGCKDGDLGLTNPSYNSGFIRICTADKNGNPLPADDIYGTIQHEISHAFGIGHSNIPGELMCSAEFYGETCPANLSPDNAKSDNFMFATMFKMCGTNGFQGCGQNAFSGSRYEVGETVGGSPNFQNDLSVDAHNLINKYPILKDPACAADRNCSPPRFGQTLSTLNACSIVHTCPSVDQLKQGYNQQCDGDTQCEGLTNLDYFQQGVPGSLLRASTITPTTAANQTTITPTSPTLNATSPTSPTLNATSPSPPPTSSAKNNNSNILSNCPDGSPPAADGTCPAPSISNPTQPCIDNPALGLTCPSAPLPPKPVTCPDGSPPAADGSCPSPLTPQSQGGQQSLTSPPPDPCSQDPSSPGCQPTAPPPDNTPPPTSPYSWYGSSSHAPLKSA